MVCFPLSVFCVLEKLGYLPVSVFVQLAPYKEILTTSQQDDVSPTSLPLPDIAIRPMISYSTITIVHN